MDSFRRLFHGSLILCQKNEKEEYYTLSELDIKLFWVCIVTVHKHSQEQQYLISSKV